ncbi:SDR family NAD(P)-dependent oxidoreductase [Streptomyces sp. NE06-03E]|uniref:SDR family oxidoreductase n=1 Tax=Streptomyces sp. NE06-03E TaxID=3028695 RepID=UPI0029A9F3EC|nr:SDR family NAD(P)-dependent oxidoreductase [Streptomyces sp. NE06-03E]MDX3060087.1 SDR family NAD(P)-dependent oxidoreductase [Streptomyces sp. NE06-03E]
MSARGIELLLLPLTKSAWLCQSLTRSPTAGNRQGKTRSKIALITGATSGIDYAIAEELISRGQQVVITGRDQERVDAATAKLGPQASGVRADVASAADMDALYGHVAEHHGLLDTAYFAPLSLLWPLVSR